MCLCVCVCVCVCVCGRAPGEGVAYVCVCVHQVRVWLVCTVSVCADAGVVYAQSIRQNIKRNFTIVCHI